MKVWVDADALPGVIKEIITRAAARRTVDTVFVANKTIALPHSSYLSSVQVELGTDAADRYICEQAGSHDLVVTHDLLLADALVAQGIIVIDPRGDIYTDKNIGNRVSARSLMQDLRETGDITGGPRQFGDKERNRFANAFDRELTRLLRRCAAEPGEGSAATN